MNQIECPSCHHLFDVQASLREQIEASIRSEVNQELIKHRQQHEAQLALIRTERDQLDADRANQHDRVSALVQKQLKLEEQILRERLRSELASESEIAISSLRTALAEKSEQVKTLHHTQAELEQVRREKDEQQAVITARMEQVHSRQLEAERAAIAKLESEKSALKLAERDQVISQLNGKLKDAQRQAEQGSMQLQGEVQELAIESWLMEHCPLDVIREIRKGVRGADCLQTVNTHHRINCGTIYYESKRTKRFQDAWIDKLRQDMCDANASIGVLVTETMPRDMSRMGLRDGIWVCSFEEFKGLSMVLRENLITLSSALSSQENRGEKMALLYDYLTGNEFRMQVESIVDGFTQMQSELLAEKRAMLGIWKRREKQIEKVLLNTNYLYSSVRGIAGNAVPRIAQLELAGEIDAA